jgi:hypothetical protein
MESFATGSKVFQFLGNIDQRQFKPIGSICLDWQTE